MADPNNVFRQLFVSDVLTDGIIVVLKKWLPTYIREVERQLALPVGLLPRPRRYTNRNKQDALPGEDIPKVVVICPGLMGVPLKTGNQQYRATWRIGVGVACAAQDETTVQLHATMYGAAVRGVMLQKAGEYGSANTEWLDEGYDDLPISDQITLYRAAALWFGVDVENVATRKFGPEQPDQEPYEYAVVEQVIIEGGLKE